MQTFPYGLPPYNAFHSSLGCRHGYKCQCDLVVSGELKTLILRADEGRIGLDASVY